MNEQGTILKEGTTSQLQHNDVVKQLEALEKMDLLKHSAFYVGQNLEIGGRKFRVIEMTRRTVTLRIIRSVQEVAVVAKKEEEVAI
jgi:hypothetical protein